MTRPPRRTATEALARVPPGAHLVSQPGMAAPGTLLAALGSTCHGRGWTLSSGILLDDDYPFLDAVDSAELAYRTWHVTAALGRGSPTVRVGGPHGCWISATRTRRCAARRRRPSPG